MIGTCPRCGQTSPTSHDAGSPSCPACGHGELVTSQRPPSAEASVEPLWGAMLLVCMAVSLAVFIAALFLARAGASAQSPLALEHGACAGEHATPCAQR